MNTTFIKVIVLSNTDLWEDSCSKGHFQVLNLGHCKLKGDDVIHAPNSAYLTKAYRPRFCFVWARHCRFCPLNTFQKWLNINFNRIVKRVIEKSTWSTRENFLSVTFPKPKQRAQKKFLPSTSKGHRFGQTSKSNWTTLGPKSSHFTIFYFSTFTVFSSVVPTDR